MIDPQMSGGDMLAGLSSGAFTATDLALSLAAPLERARRLNALIPLDIDVSGQAAAADARRASGTAGLLDGVPITVKDNIALDDWPTTGGSPALADYRPARGTAIDRLLAAGAIVTAKTNLHELAFGITGANACTGPARNPFDPKRLAGGSSSGGAAAVALGACAIAIGTDTGGSCRVPAAHCGVVGFRPSTYRYAIDGYLRLSPSRDTLGIMARCIADVALADSVIAPEHGALPPIAARGLRIGIIRFAPLDTGVAQAFEHCLDRLQQAGIELVEVDISEAIAADEACGFVIALYETARSIGTLAREACGMDLTAFAETIASPDVRALIASQCGADAVPPEVYAEAVTVHLPRLRAAYARALESVDALACPTTPLTAPPVDIGETIELGEARLPVFPAYTMVTRPDSMAGVPTISLPGGLAGGLPTGFQLTGRAGQDRRLLAIAQCLESILPPRPVPPREKADA